MVIPFTKKKKELKPFKYPHSFQIGDLVKIKDQSLKTLRAHQDIFATIIDIKKDEGVEKMVLYWQNGITQEWSLPNLVLHFEKL